MKNGKGKKVAEATKLREIDLLRCQNLALRLELLSQGLQELNKEKMLLDREINETYAIAEGDTILSDGTIQRKQPTPAESPKA